MKKGLFVGLCLIASAIAHGESMWTGLTPENHKAGPEIAEFDLLGKIVLVTSDLAEKRVDEIWAKFKTKRFMVVGTIQGAVSAASLEKKTYPVYKGFALAAGAPKDKYYVVNHRGKVIFSGATDREATEAVVNAITDLTVPPSLTGSTILRGKFKAYEKKLVLGKNVKNDVKALEAMVKKGTGKTATKVQVDDADVAKDLLTAINDAKGELKEEIELAKKFNPEEAIKLIKDFQKTFPDEGKEYKEALVELAAKAKEFKAAAAAAKAKK